MSDEDKLSRGLPKAKPPTRLCRAITVRYHLKVVCVASEQAHTLLASKRVNKPIVAQS